ncbi:MAG: NTP transferase domain-containing protein [Planctomycetota bacterium]|nr:NTP transferase domain-containing protein [Planctomycetota bacterium]
MTRGAVVLCGGHSTRMGRDKATLPFGAETLLRRVVGILRPLVEEVTVVGRRDQVLPALPADVRVAHDAIENRGPLGGLQAALTHAQADVLYVTACDAPFLAPAFVTLLFESLGEADIAVAETEGFTHPLAAVYRRSVLPVVERLLQAERLRPVFLYAEVPTVRVPGEVLRRADPSLASLDNLNTPEAYAAALARLKVEGGGRVRIELYEGARQLAGVAAVDVEAATLGEALRALAAAQPGLVPRVIEAGELAPHWRASRNGRAFLSDPEAALEPGDTLLIVSALAGG